MFDRNALEYLVGLGQTEVIVVDGLQYSTKPLHHVKYPAPAEITVTTLTGLIDYLKSGTDHRWGKLLIHVVSPATVELYSELREDEVRENYVACKALLPNIQFGKFIDAESFNIMLQSNFVENKDKAILLQVTGCIQDKAVKEVGDDGVSQAVTIKTGVAKVGDVLVPNPVVLAPYRTFPEIQQPESKFIFRMQSGPQAALFEADGGAWRNEAMGRIKSFLKGQLEGLDNIQIIS